MEPNESPRVFSVSSCLTIIVFGMMIFVGLFFYFAVRVPGNPGQAADENARALMTVIPAPTISGDESTIRSWVFSDIALIDSTELIPILRAASAAAAN